MKQKKRWEVRAPLAALLTVALAAALLGGCTAQTDDGTTSDTNGAGVTNTSASDKVKAEDLDDSWDEETATKITLSGDTITVDGAGATVNGSTVTITAAGTYLLRGSLSDGQVVVEAPDDDLVRLVLDGASIHCGDSAPINCVTADKMLVILAEGSENELSDGDSYSFPDAQTDEPSATLFSKQDLTLGGTGSLTVTAGYNNGIGTKDDLIIVSGEITVTAANHAIRGRDSVTVLDGALTLDAAGDGIQSNNDKDADKGWIELYGGTYNITAVNDGIQAETSLLIGDGEYDITTGGGSANAPERAEEAFGPGGFGGGQMPDGMTPPEDGTFPDDGTFPGGGTPPDGMEMPTDGTPPTGDAAGGDGTGTQAEFLSSADEAAALTDAAADMDNTEEETGENTSDSFKGIKAGGDMTISGGSFTIDSADDALHTNANMTIGGGTFTIATGDDGAHADTDLLVEGDPTILITTCYEGLEGTNVTVAGGDITITASDDGINAAGGSDDTTGDAAAGEEAAAAEGGMGMFGPDAFSGGGDYLITISGGVTRITADYDGLDSNGDILVTGGELYIGGSIIGGGDAALDCDGSFAVTGGTVAAAATSGFAIMGQGSSSINAEGSQAILLFQFTDAQSAGTAVQLKDSAGNTLVNYAPEKEFQQIVLSHADLKDGVSYTVYADGSEVATVTLSGLLTAISETGEAVDASMQVPGGGGNMGGWPGGRGQNG